MLEKSASRLSWVRESEERRPDECDRTRNVCQANTPVMLRSGEIPTI